MLQMLQRPSPPIADIGSCVLVIFETVTNSLGFLKQSNAGVAASCVQCAENTATNKLDVHSSRSISTDDAKQQHSGEFAPTKMGAPTHIPIIPLLTVELSVSVT